MEQIALQLVPVTQGLLANVYGITAQEGKLVWDLSKVLIELNSLVKA